MAAAMARAIDLRSDTVTRPGLGMRKAMMEAEVGDDVFGEDPTVQRLEARVADLLGKDAGLFVPSGTMGNQIAIRAHTEPGDEVIIEAAGHSFAYESGGLSALAGVQARTVRGTDGILDPSQVKDSINPPSSNFARTRLVIIENTSNRGGGTIYPAATTHAIAELARAHQLALHIDGARLWNAHIATGTPLRELAARADSLSVCLSKGLGAPIGSVVVGTKDFITRVHRFRKMYGGGMRQVGILAAAGLYALDHNLERLREDHQNLQLLASGLGAIPGLSCAPERFPTNIAYVAVTRVGQDAPAAAARLKAAGVLVHATSPREFRVVTHLDVDRAAVLEAVERARSALA
jgi:threonine aldolase